MMMVVSDEEEEVVGFVPNLCLFGERKSVVYKLNVPSSSSPSRSLSLSLSVSAISSPASLSLSIPLPVTEKGKRRERDRETQIETQTQTDTQTERQTQTEIHTERQNQIDSETDRNIDRETERQPLFAEHIWPGALVIADYLSVHPDLCRGKRVLELGAGAGLPSLVASKLGAKLVVCADFPDSMILDNLRTLAEANKCNQLVVEPHEWGDDPANLLSHLKVGEDHNGILDKQQSFHNNDNVSQVDTEDSGFDVIILAECLWKDTYPLHSKLLRSVKACCRANNSTQPTLVLISFAHRPCENHTPLKDLEFLDKAEKEFGMKYSLIETVNKYQDAMESDFVTAYLYIAQNHFP